MTPTTQSITAGTDQLNGAASPVGAVDEVAPEGTPWERLRAPFPAERIGHLPPRGGVVLDYVGHADVTDRLLAVDPYWNWVPLASEEDGMPRFVRNEAGRPIGLWIKLTVHFEQPKNATWQGLGVTRLGYGSVKADAFDAEKQLIGDALRNAAMRFGVALDLWRKEEAHPAPPASRDSVRAQTQRSEAPQAAPATQSPTRVSLLTDVMAMDGQPRMTILQAFGYRSNLPINKWVAQLDEDVAARLAHALKPGNEDAEPLAVAAGDVDPDEIPF